MALRRRPMWHVSTSWDVAAHIKGRLGNDSGRWYGHPLQVHAIVPGAHGVARKQDDHHGSHGMHGLEVLDTLVRLDHYGLLIRTDHPEVRGRLHGHCHGRHKAGLRGLWGRPGGIRRSCWAGKWPVVARLGAIAVGWVFWFGTLVFVRRTHNISWE